MGRAANMADGPISHPKKSVNAHSYNPVYISHWLLMIEPF